MKLLYILIGFLVATTPVLAANSTLSCVNGNTTLREIISVSQVNASNVSQALNTTAYSIDTLCTYNCDPVNKSCNPPQYQASLIALGIISFIILALYKIYKWL